MLIKWIMIRSKIKGLKSVTKALNFFLYFTKLRNLEGFIF